MTQVNPEETEKEGGLQGREEFQPRNLNARTNVRVKEIIIIN